MEIYEKMFKDLGVLKNKLTNGEFMHYSTFSPELVCLVGKFINNSNNLIENDYDVIRELIVCCNVAYQNFDDKFILVDEDYDAIVNLYKNHRNDLPIGATIHKNSITRQVEREYGVAEKEKKLIEPITIYNKDKILYFDNIFNSPNLHDRSHRMIDPITIQGQNLEQAEDLSKRLREVPHLYNELAGSLSKCKYVLNNDAQMAGDFNNPTALIFERDFIGKHIQAQVLDPTNISLVLELKYDGVSLEAECTDKIISARMRGDVVNDKATDLTPIFKDFVFPAACKAGLGNAESIGVQFEIIMTKENLLKYNDIRGYDYKNCRTAVSGLLSSSDVMKYKNLLTLVPIRTSISTMFNNRLAELEYVTKYYSTGLTPKYTHIFGDYTKIMYEVSRFVKDAYEVRPLMQFMFDGIVLSYTENNIRGILGRTNSMDNYSTAIKFPPLKVVSTFRGYTYTIGQDGSVTPMINYDTVNFYGTTHDKSSGHSFKRVKDLDLAIGDPIYVTYVNDVMPYVTKPGDIEFVNNNPKEKFIDKCPACGGPLTSKTDAAGAMYCTNKQCPGIKFRRLVNMVAKLGFVDISDETVKKLNINSFVEFMNLTKEKMLLSGLGELTSDNLINQIIRFKETPITDYKVIGSLGFTNMSDESWKLILKEFTIDDLLTVNPDILRGKILNIKGIGDVKVNTIFDELKLFYDDLVYINNMKNIQPVSVEADNVAVVRFSGIRDKNLEQILQQLYIDADGEKSLTKKTDILIIPDDPGYVSSKTVDANKYGILVVPISQMWEVVNQVMTNYDSQAVLRLFNTAHLFRTDQQNIKM